MKRISKIKDKNDPGEIDEVSSHEAGIKIKNWGEN
jgi:hypothetical protein